MAHTNALVLTMGPSDLAQSSGTRALALAQALHDWDAQAQTLSLLQGVYVYRGEHRKAREAAEQLHQVARQTGNAGTITNAERIMGITSLSAGRLAEARENFERVVQSAVRRADYRLPGVLRSDDRVLARAMLGLVLCLQGNIGSAFAHAQAALDELRPDRHQSSHVRALYYGLCRISLVLGDLELADCTVRQLVEAATRSNLRFWMTAGQLLDGRRLVARGDHAKGVAVLKDGLAICDGAGWRVSYPEYKGALALGLAGLGRLDEAMVAMDGAIADAGVSGGGQVWYLPEFLRTKAEMLIHFGPGNPPAAAGGLFTQAAAMARQHGALLWELRIALSQARLQSAQDRREDGKTLVAAVLSRFPEGVDTLDTQGARAFLDGA